MHMISKKDLNSAELGTLTTSGSPTIVITANGEVQTHEEATVYVKELIMKVLEHTPAVLSLGKLCDENGYSYEWINGQKPHLIKNWIRIQCNTENFVPVVVPSLSSSSSPSSSTLRTPMKQESHSSSSSSSSSSSPTVGEVQVREREDATNNDISPVPVSELVDDIQCNTENFVPIVVPGLSTSSSSSLPSSASMTSSNQEIDHPKSSSSSSTSPPRGDQCGINHHPATVSSERVERQERRDPYSSETSEELLTKPTKKTKTK